MNILDYVKSTIQTFDELPFTPVDALILSQLAYTKLELAEEGRPHIRKRLGYTAGDFFRNEYFPLLFCDGISDPLNRELLAYVTASRRFRELRIREIVAETSDEKVKQFAAMVFELDAETDFVAFRGTDGSLSGWKEDFNLSFMNEVPSQTAAVDYINRLYGKDNRHGRRRKIYIGGHSKGGNLAVYSAAMCDAEIHSRILEVYSLDGPGFRSEVLEQIRRVQERDSIRITKLVPQSSLIGMLMQSTEDYRVVQSDAVGIMQHLAYNWQLDESGKDFEYLSELSSGGEYFDQTVHDWLMSVDDAQREIFTNALFGILERHGVKKLHDLKSMKMSDIGDMLSSLGDLDEETRGVVGYVLKELAGAAVGAAVPKIPSGEQIREWLRRKARQEEAEQEE